MPRSSEEWKEDKHIPGCLQHGSEEVVAQPPDDERTGTRKEKVESEFGFSLFSLFLLFRPSICSIGQYRPKNKTASSCESH